MKKTRMLLILGTRQDEHVDRVAVEIAKRSDIAVSVIDYLSYMHFEFKMSSSGSREFRINGDKLPARMLVWNRSKILVGTELYTKGDDVSSGYSAQEWRALYTLIGGFNRTQVVNSLESRACMIKPYQQSIAASVGFPVPPTLVTNDKTSATEFFHDANSGLILKSLSGGKVKSAGEGESIPYNIMTMRVMFEDLNNAQPDEIACCPHFFQHEIHKNYELRVVVVGDEIIPFKVFSQASKTSELDWRRGLDFVEFKKAVISEDVNEKIRSFMVKMGLFTGSLDLIVDKDGRVWFLECNQDGAWGWLDDLVDGGITQAFARALSERLDTICATSGSGA